MTIFLRIFLRYIFHIFVGQKIKILENRPDFLTFSAKTQNQFLDCQILAREMLCASK